MLFRYRAIQIKQTNSTKLLAMFSAPATDIAAWAGVPQKKRFGTGEETAGFQREENPARIKSLREFYSNSDNIIQNPLLCSTRNLSSSAVRFEPSSDAPFNGVENGEVIIEVPDFSPLSFREIIGGVRKYIEGRVPELANREPDPNLLASLKARASATGHLLDEATELTDDTGLTDDSIPDTLENGDAEAALFEESHIVDFWQEIAARHEISKMIEIPPGEDEFIGFQREALLSYLRPVVLVDGQHRLRGAIRAAEVKLDDPEIQKEIESLIAQGAKPEEVEVTLIRREARHLPISLLMSDDPSEQVFQFVVVNQKATPIGRALLGTIVSTTLSNDEMGKVAARLKSAGIQLEESQAITYLARHPNSPFCGLVERGLAGDQKGLLQWNVFASLISIFRGLRGGKLFGQRNDYAELWRNRFLASSQIVGAYAVEGCETPYEYWYRLDGPWRDVFTKFWTCVRDSFGNVSDPDKHNYWGRTRESNLFNKISLTILAADFFQFLVETKSVIDTAGQVNDLVNSWLENVNKGYFDKDWNLAGVKKDSTGIRNQWAFLWSEYRKSGGNLPDRRLFRQPKGD